MTRFELIRRSAGPMLRRALVDRKARWQLLVLLFWAMYAVGYYFLLRQQAREAGPWGFVFSAVVLLLALGGVRLIRRSHGRAEDGLLKLSTYDAPTQDDLHAHAERLSNLLLRTAVIVDRAGGESLFRNGKTPPEHVGVCRRRTLDLAQRTDLWDKFSREEQDLLRSQEGSWEWNAVWPRLMQAEDVRVLRWVLKIDDILTPFAFLTFDLTPALQVTAKPGTVMGRDCRAAYDLRPEQTIARVTANRCVGEGLRRGFMNDINPAVREGLLRAANDLAENKSEDLILGGKTVAEAEPRTVSWIATAAIRRDLTLTPLIDYLNGPPDAALTLSLAAGPAEDRCGTDAV